MPTASSLPSLFAGDKTVDTVVGLRNAGAARDWAKLAALQHRRSTIAPAVHGEEHTVYGNFEL